MEENEGEISDSILQLFRGLAEHRLLTFSLTSEDIKPHKLEMVLAFSEWGGVVLPEKPYPISQEINQQSQSQWQSQQRLTSLLPSPFVNNLC